MDDRKIIVALDYPSSAEALAVAEKLPPDLCRVKVGLELFVSAGPIVIEQLHALGHEIFLDLKFHDIPNTVAGACKAAASMGVWMLNVHCLGSARMMEAARSAVDQAGHAPILIGVTVLTSHDKSDLQALGLSGTPESEVLRLAQLAQRYGLDGVVCSPQEVTAIKAACAPGFIKVTPGIRPPGANLQDQARVMTPQEALQAGADFLVIGRPITRSSSPGRVLKELIGGIQSA